MTAPISPGATLYCCPRVESERTRRRGMVSAA